MNFLRPRLSRYASSTFAIVLGVGMVLSARVGQSEFCTLSATHAELTFPVEQVDAEWACRLHTIIQSYSTVSRVGPIRAEMSEFVYRYLLDDPPLATTLIERLALGLYKSEERGSGRFWGDDGEGTKGIIHLVYEDRTSRIYYLEGSHESRLLPLVTGKAVVFLRMDAVKSTHEGEAIDSTMVAYTKLDNRFLSEVVSFLHPLVGRIVKSRLQKGVETVNRLGVIMRQDPQRVLSVVSDAPPLADNHVAFLKTVLGPHPNPGTTNSPARTIP
jgi:hypothetical protein